MSDNPAKRDTYASERHGIYVFVHVSLSNELTATQIDVYQSRRSRFQEFLPPIYLRTIELTQNLETVVGSWGASSLLGALAELARSPAFEIHSDADVLNTLRGSEGQLLHVRVYRRPHSMHRWIWTQERGDWRIHTGVSAGTHTWRCGGFDFALGASINDLVVVRHEHLADNRNRSFLPVISFEKDVLNIAEACPLARTLSDRAQLMLTQQRLPDDIAGHPFTTHQIPEVFYGPDLSAEEFRVAHGRFPTQDELIQTNCWRTGPRHLLCGRKKRSLGWSEAPSAQVATTHTVDKTGRVLTDVEDYARALGIADPTTASKVEVLARIRALVRDPMHMVAEVREQLASERKERERLQLHLETLFARNYQQQVLIESLVDSAGQIVKCAQSGALKA